METIILIAYYSSIALALYAECWPEDAAVDPQYENEELLEYAGEFAYLDSWSVNINTATYPELQTISGIGKDKAKAIIKYRTQNGKFASIEQITEVDGISDSLFEKIRDKITV